MASAAAVPIPSFNNVVYGAVVTGKVDEKELEKAGADVLSYGRSKYLELLKYAEDGDWTWRVAGFGAGCFMMFTSFFEFFSNFFGLSPFLACLDLYIFCFGALAVCLEYKDQLVTEKYVDLIKKEAHFLTTPYGRAGFYFFVGLLMACKGGILNWIGGIFCVIIGVIIFRSSRRSYEVLEQLRGSKNTVDQVRSKFKYYDKDRSGQLDTPELAVLCASLGSTMTRQELESALFILDTDGNGRISEDEFVNWWTGKK